MKRDAEATRRRILDAAVAEFAARGIAGGRVDRIAVAAGCNKAMIYAYFTSKDGLFDAAFHEVVVRTVADVPLDATDLPGYAVQLFDQHLAHPEPLRLLAWDRLERGGAGMGVPAVVEALNDKVEAVAKAQADGLVSNEVDAAVLVELVVALSRIGTEAPLTVAEAARHRAGISAGAARLVRR